MIHYISHIKDVIGQNYLGIKINNETIEPFLRKLQKHLGEEFEEYINNQQKRDNSSYHITVINTMDYNKLSKEIGISKFVSSLDSIFKFEIDDLKLLGIGTAQRNENRSFFIVCSSDKLTSVRTRYNLSEHDFHITIGFKHKDVFGVRKNVVMDFEDSFKSVIKNKYEEERNWDFIKQIDNYTYNKFLELIPIEIRNTNMKFLVGNDVIIVTYLEDQNKFRIIASYSKDKDYIRMPMAKIIEILKN
jgi:hypothetical protein